MKEVEKKGEKGYEKDMETQGAWRRRYGDRWVEREREGRTGKKRGN